MRRNRRWKALLSDKAGTSAVEYGIILAFIVFGLFIAVGGVATETLKMWTKLDTETAKASTGG